MLYICDPKSSTSSNPHQWWAGLKEMASWLQRARLKLEHFIQLSGKLLWHTSLPSTRVARFLFFCGTRCVGWLHGIAVIAISFLLGGLFYGCIVRCKEKLVSAVYVQESFFSFFDGWEETALDITCHSTPHHLLPWHSLTRNIIEINPSQV